MAKVVIGAEVKVETGQAGQKVGDLKKQFTDATQEAVKIGKAFGENSKEFDKAKEKLVGLTTQFKSFAATAGTLKEAKLQLQGIVAVFGETSKEAVAAAKYVAQLKDQIGDTKELVNSFNPDAKFAAFSGAIQGVTAGFSALQGAQALFGSESKELEATLLKVQAAMALSQGINGIFAAKDAFTNLIAVVKNSAVFIKANALATNLASATMKAFGVSVDTTSRSFKFLKGAIAATGIGLLLIALSEAVEAFQNFTGAAEKAAAAQAELNDQIKKNADQSLKDETDYITRSEKLQLAKAKLAGATEQELFDLEQSFRAKKIEAQIRYYDQVKDIDADAAASTKAAINNANTDGQLAAIANLQRIKEEREKDLKKQQNERDKLREKLQRDYEKRLQDFKDFQERRRIERLKDNADELKQIEEFGQQLRDKDAENAQAKIDNDKAIKQFELEQKQALAEQQLLNDPNSIENKKAKIEADLAIELEGLEKGSVQAQNATLRAEQEKTRIESEGTEARIEIAKREKESKLQLFDAVGGALSALGEVVGKETAAGKVLSIASAVINTYTGATKALSAYPGPIGIASAAAVILSGLASVRKIIAVKVPGKGGGGSTPSISASQSSPVLPGTTNTNLNAASINAIGNAASRTFVLETDVTNNQERIRRLNRAARIN